MLHKVLLQNYDLIFDATGNQSVHELVGQFEDKLLGWGYVKPGPDYGVLFLRRWHSGLMLSEAEDFLHQDNPSLWKLIEEKDEGLVWTEPGCYHPTFRAPFYRLRMMTDAFLSTLLAWIGEDANSDVFTLYGQKRDAKNLGTETQILYQRIF